MEPNSWQDELSLGKPKTFVVSKWATVTPNRSEHVFQTQMHISIIHETISTLWVFWQILIFVEWITLFFFFAVARNLLNKAQLLPTNKRTISSIKIVFWSWKLPLLSPFAANFKGISYLRLPHSLKTHDVKNPLSFKISTQIHLMCELFWGAFYKFTNIFSTNNCSKIIDETEFADIKDSDLRICGWR